MTEITLIYRIMPPPPPIPPPPAPPPPRPPPAVPQSLELKKDKRSRKMPCLFTPETSDELCLKDFRDKLNRIMYVFCNGSRNFCFLFNLIFVSK